MVGTFEIVETQAIRTLEDTVSLSGEPIKTVNLLVSVSLRGASGEIVRGHGESQLRGIPTGDKRTSSLTLMDSILEHLEGKKLTLASITDAQNSIAELMGSIQESLLPTEIIEDATLSSSALPRPFAGTLFGVESALTHAAAQALGLSEAAFISSGKVGEQTQTAVFPLLTQLKPLDSSANAELLENPRFGIPQGSIWVDLTRRLTVASATRWIKRELKKLSLGELQQTLYLYRPLKRALEGEYRTLVNAIEQIEGLPDANRVVIVREIDSLDFEDDADLLARKTYALAVRPTAVGGLNATYDLVDRVVGHAPGARVYLMANSGGSRVAQKDLEQLSSSHLAIRGLVTTEPELAMNRATNRAKLTEQYWRDALEASGVQVHTSGEIFKHSSNKSLNYYEEEKYLGPVGAQGAKLRLLQKSALLAGFNTVQYSQAAFVITDRKDDDLLFFASATPLNSAAAKSICNHKESTRLILQQQGVPVPEGRSFNSGDYETARKFAEQLGYPVVVKPAMGTQGIGVKAGIQNEHELDLAFEHFASSRLASQGFIVEKHIYGEEYRILVVGNEVIAAVRREPASVIGDGVHSIAELIIRKNRFRRTNPQLGSSPITYTSDTTHMLSAQGLNLNSVPEFDQHIVLSSSSNISQGGDSRELLDDLHPSVIEASIRAVEAIPGLNYCGVDFLLEDPSLPLDEQSAGICELNAQAASGTAEYPLFGKHRPVPRKTIESCIDMYGMDVVPPADMANVSVKLRIRGRVTGVGFRNWFTRWAKEFGVVGRIWNAGTRTVEAEIMGEALAVAALSAGSVTGSRRAKPTSVITQHIDPIPFDDFEILANPPYAEKGRNLVQWLKRR